MRKLLNLCLSYLAIPFRLDAEELTLSGERKFKVSANNIEAAMKRRIVPQIGDRFTLARRLRTVTEISACPVGKNRYCVIIKYSPVDLGK